MRSLLAMFALEGSGRSPVPGRISVGGTAPGGTYFNLSFDPADVATAESLQLLSATGTYGFRNCSNRYRVCTSDDPGPFTIRARTSAVAPAMLGWQEIVTYSAVPEPASWGMMILGAGAIGASLRGRLRRRVRSFERV